MNKEEEKEEEEGEEYKSPRIITNNRIYSSKEKIDENELIEQRI